MPSYVVRYLGKSLVTRSQTCRGTMIPSHAHRNESLHDMNVGLGARLVLSYSATDHKGFDNVYATMVKHGQPILLTD